MRKYDEVVVRLKEKMRCGEYDGGMKMGCIGDLGCEYGVSKRSVMKGVERLEREDVVYCVERRGYYVVKRKE
ncbi:GntR family transcriptional regulator [Bacillus pumilus]|uniref:GntR family transcriptional regulator n=1 Tax=Bacillus pumilus TaxID=1408 RepID=UPI0016430FF2|nr:GntR family transcriptional regulator [Bacillus pumilus]